MSVSSRTRTLIDTAIYNDNLKEVMRLTKVPNEHPLSVLRSEAIYKILQTRIDKLEMKMMDQINSLMQNGIGEIQEIVRHGKQPGKNSPFKTTVTTKMDTKWREKKPRHDFGSGGKFDSPSFHETALKSNEKVRNDMKSRHPKHSGRRLENPDIEKDINRQREKFNRDFGPKKTTITREVSSGGGSKPKWKEERKEFRSGGNGKPVVRRTEERREFRSGGGKPRVVKTTVTTTTSSKTGNGGNDWDEFERKKREFNNWK